MATKNVLAHDFSESDTAQAYYHGLRTPGLLGRRPWIGWLMFLVGALVFGAFTYSVTTHSGPLLQWDKPVSTILPAYGLQHQNTLKPIIDAGYYIGGWILTILGFVFLIYFWVKHYWEELWMVLVGMVGESILFEVISNLVGRARPPNQMWIILHIPGFPSGHTEATVVFYGLLAYLLVPKIRSSFGKFLIILLTVLIMLFVGFSRVFTAAHYVSDVLAGYALGLAWAGLAYTSVELYFKNKSKRSERYVKSR